MKTWKRLAQNQNLWNTYFVREQVIKAIRQFFYDHKFHEVETPYLTPHLPPESYIDIFETTLYSRDRKPTKAYLPTSPEPFLKKLLVAGIGNCFAMPKSFRNTEDKSKTHNPEYTILEWYRVNEPYTEIMKDCEELLIYINMCVNRMNKKTTDNNLKIIYQGTTVDLSSPWERLTVCEAFKRYADIDLERALTRETIVPFAKNKQYTIQTSDTWEVIFNQIFLNVVEPHLGKGKPTILYEYPATLAALSRKKASDPRFAERFEFYIEGLELGDAYGELTDWKEQLRRFKAEDKERKRLGKVRHPIDMDFIDALKFGLPPSSGIAVGVDRLIMLFADVDDIAQTLFFPASEEFPS